MGFGWKQKKVSPIGIDFGTESIKLIQMEYGEPPRIIAAAGIDIPIDARRDADARQAFIAQSLRELVREGKFKGKQVVGSIPASQTYVLHTRVPKGDENHIQSQVEVSLRSQLPIDPARMVVRHYPVCDISIDGQTQQEILCMAATRETVMRHVQAMDQAGLEVAGMHCEPFAVVQSFKHLYRRAGDENLVTFYIDIGAAMTKVIITHGTEVVFAKNIQVAGEHFTRYFAKQNDMDVQAARLMRIQMALSDAPKGAKEQAPQTRDERETERRKNNTPPGMAVVQVNEPNEQSQSHTQESYQQVNGDSQTQTMTQPTQRTLAQSELMETLIDELKMCRGYHDSLFDQKQIDKLVFIGGEAAHVDHCKQIAHALRAPAQLGDPLSRLGLDDDARVIGIDLNYSQPAWAIPMGLCLLAENR